MSGCQTGSPKRTLFSPLTALLAYRLASWLFHSGFARKNEQRHNRVMKLFRYAADRQHLAALSTYGHLLLYRGTAFSDKEQGALYLQQAANKGDAKAQYQIGKLYDYGELLGWEVSGDRAIELYEQAAQQDHPLAIKRLIELYATPEHKNAERAQFWQARH